ncbi:MAG TPA: M48 family metallopeptidase [Streptosporangiaceae bacterium]|nr:M48 family metallopeptidase [Streptosporangiaceae bacterium]
MTSVPDRSRIRLPGISSRAYEHPADRSALVALRKLTGFDTIVRNLAGLFNDRALRLMYLASAVRVSQEQFPDLHQAMLDGCYILDLERVPEMYVSQNPYANAFAFGLDKPFIVLYSGIVELMDEEEIRFVIGHELGHVLSGHTVYNTMLRNLLMLVSRLALVPFAWLGLRAVIWGLEEWSRKAEMSSDRAGLLATQDVDAARRALMKLAGGRRLAEFSSDEFHKQAREYDAVPDVRESLLKLLQLQGQTHPFAVVRFAELDRWADEGEYRDILAGNYPRRDDDPDASVGDEFRSAAKSYQDSWNRSADPLIGAVRGVANGAADMGSRIFNRMSGNDRRDDRDDD